MQSAIHPLHMVQFAICCRMPYSLLFVAACRTVCYLLLYAVQFAICCRMPYSLLYTYRNNKYLIQCVVVCVSIIYSLVSVLVSVSHGGCWSALVLESIRSIAQSVLAEHCIYVWYASLASWLLSAMLGGLHRQPWLQRRFENCDRHKSAGHSRQVEGAFISYSRDRGLKQLPQYSGPVLVVIRSVNKFMARIGQVDVEVA